MVARACDYVPLSERDDARLGIRQARPPHRSHLGRNQYPRSRGRAENRRFDGGFAPPLFLVPEKLRAEILAERPRDVPYLLWAIAELEMMDGTLRLACENPGIDEKLEQIFQLTIRATSKSNYAPVRKMFQRVC